MSVGDTTESRYMCPVCKRELMSADELCSGSFLDDHPSNVPAVPTQAWSRMSDSDRAHMIEDVMEERDD